PPGLKSSSYGARNGSAPTSWQIRSMPPLDRGGCGSERSSGLDRNSHNPIWSRASWAIPPLFCVAFYWYGLKCWFRQDDFAWLQLTGQIHNWRDFLRAMFTPMAQGSIRPFSERAFFMGFYALFGLNALPFRICVFLTQIANLTLIRWVAQRVTGSAAAGFWAALLWTATTARS